MRHTNTLYSIIAGVLTPFALLLIGNGMLGHSYDTSNPLRVLALATSFLLALGIALWRPISPIIYGAALAVTCVVVPFAFIATGSWGNLGGLVFIVAATFGLLIGAGVALLGSLLRHITLPGWAAAGLIGAAVLAALATSAWRFERRYQQSFSILDRVQEIRRAELAYASGNQAHAFTCNGPDLPGLKIDWQPNLALGRREKYQAQVEGHWVYLRCPPSAHPEWVEIVTDSALGTGVRVTR